MIFQKDETATKQQRDLTEFYRNKYPDLGNKADMPDDAIKLTPQELQEANQSFSDGVFKANQASNADMMEKLAQAFQNRNKGA